jgi:hypothetical protein
VGARDAHTTREHNAIKLQLNASAVYPARVLHRSSSERSSLAAAPPWQELRDRGFTVARGLLDEDQVRTGRELARRITTKQLSEDYQRRHASIGSLFDLLEDPASVELITWPRTFAVLSALGFPDPRYQHGIVFNKLPHTPRTFWHQDGISWNHPGGMNPNRPWTVNRGRRCCDETGRRRPRALITKHRPDGQLPVRTRIT